MGLQPGIASSDVPVSPMSSETTGARVHLSISARDWYPSLVADFTPKQASEARPVFFAASLPASAIMHVPMAFFKAPGVHPLSCSGPLASQERS